MELIPYNFFINIVEVDNPATKSSSRDDGLVAILAISINMVHDPDGTRFDAGSC